jgi:hypothetical protein
MVPHFRDETYGDVKMPGYNVRGRIVLGLNERWSIVPVPKHSTYAVSKNSEYCYLEIIIYT